MELYNEDCIAGMAKLADNSVDMILTDLPYGGGITEFRWDKRIDFKELWKQFRRVIKNRRAIVLFGQEPFASELRVSALDLYKYDWIWRKSRVGRVLNCGYAPLSTFENIMVFSNGTASSAGNRQMLYNGQGLIPSGKITREHSEALNHFGREKKPDRDYTPRLYAQKFTNHPRDVLEFKSPSRPVHPTQKPTDLLEYLIKTYSNEGETVLDATMGSGSTGVAAVNCGRDFIGFELEKKFFDVACERIAEVQNPHVQALF